MRFLDKILGIYESQAQASNAARIPRSLLQLKSHEIIWDTRNSRPQVKGNNLLLKR